jgi:hypothetical protein
MPRRIAPRLASGECRDKTGISLPPAVKRGLRMRAYAHNQSISWALEQMIIETYGFREPRYIERKPVTRRHRG